MFWAVTEKVAFLSRCFYSTPPIAFDGNFKKHWVCVLMEIVCEVLNAQTTHLISITNKSLSEYPNYATNNLSCVSYFVICFLKFLRPPSILLSLLKAREVKELVISSVPVFHLAKYWRDFNDFLGGRGVVEVRMYLRPFVHVCPDHSAHIFLYSHRVWSVSCNLSRRHFVIVWPWCP